MVTRVALFSAADLYSFLENRKKQAVAAAGRVAAEQVHARTGEELVEHFASQFALTPVTAYRDRAESSITECQYETRDSFAYCLAPGESIMVPGVAVTVRLPYSGEEELLQYRPDTFPLQRREAAIQGPGADGIGCITFQFEFNQHSTSSDAIQREIDQAVEFVDTCVKNQARQVQRFHTELRQVLADAIARRRQSLGTVQEIAKALEIPVTQRPGMPALTPLRVAKRVLRELPPVAGVQQSAGFSITSEAYANILAAIRGQGRTFEKAPATFYKFGEEELRDILLANLNTHFQGQATGETFRAKGKTDVCIEQENRAAFVAECKIWRGSAELAAGLRQLLSYLTWRDCKAALVVFNKERSKFSEVLERAPQALRELKDIYAGEVNQPEPGEWQMTFRAPGDDARRIVVQLMVYNLHVPVQGAAST